MNFFNPHEDGWDVPGREGGKAASFNQFSSQDLTMANSIAEYVNLMNKIEEMVGELSGVSRQRQGQVTSSELVGNVERAVVQSSHITEMHFWIHNRVKQRAMEALLEAAKTAWTESSKEKLHYITDDMTRIFLDITEDFLYSDFGIFVTDSTQESRNLEAVKSLLQPAMQNGASLADVAEVIASNNLTEVRRKLKDIERARQEREERMQQQQSEVQQQIVQMQLEDKEADRAAKRYEVDANNEVKVLVAEIQSENKVMDLNRNGIADVLEGDIKEREIEENARIEDRKLELERKKLETQKELQRMKDQAALERERIRTGLLREHMSQGHSYSHSRRELEGSLAKYQEGWKVSSFPDWDEIKAGLNPKNWGVKDYTDKGEFGEAYSSARQAGEKEFMWNGKRFNTDYKGTPAQQLKETGITNDQTGDKSFVSRRLQKNMFPYEYNS